MLFGLLAMELLSKTIRDYLRSTAKTKDGRRKNMGGNCFSK